MSFSFSQKASVLRKSYGDIAVTVIIELPKSIIKDESRKQAVQVLKDDIVNLLNDQELENILNPKR